MDTRTDQNYRYPLDTAGRIMTAAVPVLRCDDSADSARKLLHSKEHKYESINYIYVLDEADVLQGVISVKELMNLDGSMPLEGAMQTQLVTVYPETDQERAVYVSLQHNIKAVPVVHRNGVFLGVVPSDVILAVLYDEMDEDLLHLAGMPTIRGGDVRSNSFVTMLRHRLPWLMLGLLGGVAAAGLVSFFEQALREYLILATFIPMIMYMGGSVLAQTQAFFIRDLAARPHLDFGRYFMRQAGLIATMGVVIGAGIFALSLAVYRDMVIANILGVALFAVVLSTIVSSLLIPYIFHRLKFDPADGSGPIATIVQDLAGITIYFLIATSMLGVM